MKLSKVAATETGILELLNGDDSPMLGDDGKQVTVTVYGPGSKPYTRAKSAQQNRMVAKLQRGKNAASETPEAKAANEAEFLAAITASDSGLDFEGLTEGLTGEEKYKAIYSHAPLGFIGEQVAKFGADWANFTKGSPKP